MSISPTFYEQLFRTQDFRAAFLYLHCTFKLFRRKEIGAKAARKMLVKLTPGFKRKQVYQLIFQPALRRESAIYVWSMQSTTKAEKSLFKHILEIEIWKLKPFQKNVLGPGVRLWIPNLIHLLYCF